MPKEAEKNKWETNGKMLDLKSTIWIFTLNVNSLNIFFKADSVRLDKKARKNYGLPYIKYEDVNKRNRTKRVYHANNIKRNLELLY